MSTENSDLYFAKEDEPGWGFSIFIMPPLVIGTLVGGYLLVFILGSMGIEAAGERVVMHFTTCEAARPILRRRLDGMGLGDPLISSEGADLVVTATLPEDPIVAQQIPQTLTRPGHFSVRDADGDHPLFTERDVDSATLRLDFATNPSTAITLKKGAAASMKSHMIANPAGSLQFFLDEQLLGERKNTPAEESGHIELKPDATLLKDGLEQSVAWALLIENGSLPCPTTVSTQPLKPSASD